MIAFIRAVIGIPILGFGLVLLWSGLAAVTETNSFSANASDAENAGAMIALLLVWIPGFILTALGALVTFK